MLNQFDEKLFQPIFQIQNQNQFQNPTVPINMRRKNCENETFKDKLKDPNKFIYAQFQMSKMNKKDLSGICLKYSQFQHAIVIECDFTNSDLEEADLREANLKQTKFFKTYLKRAKFIKCDLRNTKFIDCELEQSQFRKVKSAQKCEFLNCNLANANFDNANIKGAIFIKCQLSSINFTNANLSETIFEDINFLNCNMQNCKLRKAKFERITFQDINFSDCIFDQAEFRFNHLKDIIFNAKSLDECHFFSCLLQNIHFEEVSLQKGVFKKCILRNSYFGNTNLSNSEFTETHLIQNDFQQVNLYKSSFTQCIIENCNLQNFHKQLEGHTGEIRCIESTMDEQYILTAGVDKFISIWDTKTNKLVTTLRGHNGRIFCLAVSKDKVVSGSNDESIIIWDFESKKIQKRISDGINGAILCIAIAQDSSFIISGCSDRSVKVWNRENDQYIPKVIVEKNAEMIYCLSLSKKEKNVATGDTLLRVWDVKESFQYQIENSHDHKHRVISVTFSNDDQRIVSGGDDGAIRIWELKEYQWKQNEELIKKVKKLILSLKVQENQLIFGCDDGKFRIWSISGDEVKKESHTKTKYNINAICYLEKKKKLITGGDDGLIRVWDEIENTKIEETTLFWKDHPGRVFTLKFIPKRKLSTKQNNDTNFMGIISGGSDGILRMWNLENYTQIFSTKKYNGSVTCIDISPDGIFLASSYSDSQIRIWRIQSSDLYQLKSIRCPEKCSVLYLQFSPSGKKLISGGTDKIACLWNSKKGDKVDLKGHKASVNCVGFIEENFILTSAIDGEMKLWKDDFNLQTVEHLPHICCFTIMKELKMVITGGQKNMYVWSLNMQEDYVYHLEHLYQIDGHHCKILAITYSQDYSRLITGDEKGVLGIWDLKKIHLRFNQCEQEIIDKKKQEEIERKQNEEDEDDQKKKPKKDGKIKEKEKEIIEGFKIRDEKLSEEEDSIQTIQYSIDQSIIAIGLLSGKILTPWWTNVVLCDVRGVEFDEKLVEDLGIKQSIIKK